MPIFDFMCSKCDKKFEKVVLSNSKNDVVCPECGSNETQKVPSRAGFVINGYSEENGYSKPEVISYDGRTIE